MHRKYGNFDTKRHPAGGFNIQESNLELRQTVKILAVSLVCKETKP